jgi:hypothetical protein
MQVINAARTPGNHVADDALGNVRESGLQG